MFKRIGGLMLLGVTVAIAGCNTMAGFGRDMQSGGQKLEQSAHETQRQM